jgi:predicted HAD superfamily Cof-like phosphohydrolase
VTALTAAIQQLLEEVERLRASTIRAQVSEFHRAFGQDIGDKPAVPSDEEVIQLRVNLIGEEFCEMLEAIFGEHEEIEFIRESIAYLVEHEVDREAVDMPELAHALADLDYVVEGTRLAFGFDGGPIAAIIHANNLSKLGPDGKPLKRADGKAIKPDSWRPPDVAGELRRQGWTP